MSKSTVPLFPLGPAAFSVHLALKDVASDTAGGNPFVRLSSESSGECAFAAVLVAASGVALRRLVFKMPVEDVDILDDDGTPITGPIIAARWAAARRDLLRLRTSARFFPSLLLPAEADDEGLLPPTVYCRFHHRLFRIPCPRCFGALRTCRDDGLLAAAGLPLYSSGGARLLTCPTCAARAEEVRFYDPSSVPAGSMVDQRVADLTMLRQELAEAVTRARESGSPLPSPEVFPCATCDEPDACLTEHDSGKGKAHTVPGTAAWWPLNRHDCPYLLLDDAGGNFDAFVDCLGGRLPLGATSQSDSAGGTGFLCRPSDGAGLDAVEILALKVALFLQVAGGLREYHRLLGLPHLDLHPGHVVVDPGSSGDHLPRLWAFQARLLGTSSRRVRTLADGVTVVLPPHDPNMPFVAPEVRSAYLIRPRNAELVLDRLVPASTVKDAWHLEGHLADPQGIYPRPGPHDHIQLRWSHDLFGVAVRSAVATLDPRQAAGKSLDVAITTAPLAIDPVVAHHLERASGLRVPDITYRCYPAFGAREDLYSLGMLLLRTLLVNDEQGLDAVEGLASALLHHLGGRRPGTRGSTESPLGWALREHTRELNKTNVFFNRADRAATRPNAIPDEYWAQVIGVALELVAGTDSRPDALTDELPSAALDQAILAAGDLLRRLGTILFDRQANNVEIQSLISEVQADIA